MARKGRFFHIETMGAVDGPGVRLVLFLAGCPLRCPYCHNPEGWSVRGAGEVTVEQVLGKLRRYRGYYAGGGLTVSGGEPLLQAAFVAELFDACRAQGIHCALDTSACVEGEEADRACAAADLLLLDIKHADPGRHLDLFGFSLDMPMERLKWCQRSGKPVWIRHVVAPGISDSLEQIDALSALLAPYSCVKRVELLPYRGLCAEKYLRIGLPFPMGEAKDVPQERVRQLYERMGGVGGGGERALGDPFEP